MLKNTGEIEKFIRNLVENNRYESFDLEFKEAKEQLPKSFWETYSSFANTAGGYIVLGIKEKPKLELTGINDTDKIITDICNSANNKAKVNLNLIENGNIDRVTLLDKNIIVVYIPEANETRKPVFLNGNMRLTYIRRNEGDYLASEEDLRRFVRNSQNNLDSELLDNYTIEDLNTESILRFKNEMHGRVPSKKYLEMTNQEFLSEIGVFQIDRNDGRKKKLTLAGLLFLGKYEAIKSKFPYFHLDYLNYRGLANCEGRWRDRVSTGDLAYMELNLYEFYSIVFEKLSISVEDSFEVDDRSVRRSSTELKEAIQEALVNMLVHADYFESDITIKAEVYPLYYSFENPGNLKVSKEQFFNGGKSVPRNTTLIQYFRRMGVSDRAGTGGSDIFNMAETNKYRMPEIVSSLQSTRLKIWVVSPMDTYPGMSNNAKKIMAYLMKKKRASAKEILSDLNISSYYFRKAIAELLENKVVLLNGKGRATEYLWNMSTIEGLNILNKMQQILLGE